MGRVGNDPAGAPSREGAIVSRSPWAGGIKRGVDLALSLIGLVVSAPVVLVAVALMKITSPGPVFFLQARTGHDGREFQPLKLRTMVADWKHNPSEFMPLSHQGITPVGRVLRRLKIDELPQLYNIVRGDMALVGPRPTLPEQTRAYDDFKRQRLLVRPGITGLAQVNGNTAISWDERIKYDVYYVRHHGLMMDAGILLKTVWVLLIGEERFARPFEDSPYSRADGK